jgi:hypothetical protein
MSPSHFMALEQPDLVWGDIFTSSEPMMSTFR